MSDKKTLVMSNIEESKLSDAIRSKLVVLERGGFLVSEIKKIWTISNSIKVGEPFNDDIFLWELLFRDDSELGINIQVLSFMASTGSCEVMDNAIVIG